MFPSVSICSHGFNENLEKTIKSCLFHGNYGCNVNKSAFFEEFEDIAYGKCWRFNGRKSKKYLKSKMCGNLYVEFKNVTE